MRTATVNKLAVKRVTTYVALEDIDFTWMKDELELVIKMWNEGRSIFAIAPHLNRDIDELVLLLMDLGDKGLILPRSSGALTSTPIKPNKHKLSLIRGFLNKHKHGYVVYEQRDFIFDQYQAVTFDQLWNQNLSIQEISKVLRRKNPIETIFLMMDRSRKGKVTSRPFTLDGKVVQKDAFKPLCISK